MTAPESTRLAAIPTAGLDAWRSGRASFVEGLLPSDAVRLDPADVIALLRDRYGEVVDLALDAGAVHPDDLPADVRAKLASPVAAEPDGAWLKRANVVGINVRTVSDVWGIVPYVLTVPAIQSAIHLLPILEPGVLASMYGPISWNVDPALRSERLAALRPALDTAEQQLRAVVHLCHVMGRTVGMDVIPHTDRYAEVALANPSLYEWLERRGDRIVRHGDEVAPAVEREILRWLAAHGPAVGGAVPGSADALFRELPESARLELLFGRVADPDGRQQRRLMLVRVLHAAGLETVPATMAPPYRGIEVDPRPEARGVDAGGLEWREYRISRPTPMSRVFGPLARFHLWEAVGPGSWELDFRRPREAAWRYVIDRYADLRARIGFDWMRGDMAHVQMRPDGVARDAGDRYDLLGAIASSVRTRGVAHFAYHAESFLAPADTIGYGDEEDHLEAAGADVSLGDLQSVALDDPRFSRSFRRYLDLLETRSFAPSFTVITADKDDPRFDSFYLAGNELRLLLALLLPDMPSYMALGFEQRDVHPTPAPNEHYTKHYVFHAGDGPKATHGPYVWGSNRSLFQRLTRIRAFADELGGSLAAARVDWLRPPDATGESRLLAWRVIGDGSAGLDLVCLANLDLSDASGPFALPAPALPASATWTGLLSTGGGSPTAAPAWNGRQWIVEGLAPGEGRVYRLGHASGG